MKKYDEMAKDVFQRIEEYNIDKQRKRNKLTRVAVPAMCFCLVALLGIGAWQVGLFNKKPVQTQQDALYPGIKDWYGPGETEENPSATNIRGNAPSAEPFISMCSFQSNGTVKTDLIEPDKTYDTGFYINFTPIKGLSEAQIEKKVDELEKALESTLSQNDNNKGFGYHYGCSIMREEGYIATRAALNYFTLNLDFEKVKEIKVSNASKYGQIEVFGTKRESEQGALVPHGNSLTIGKDRITEDLSFSWNYTVIDEYLRENPNPSYKDFNDSFSFIVEFDDGTAKSANVEIVFDDSGEATVICGGYKSLKA